MVDAAERNEILNRYRDHSRRFEAVAQKRGNNGAEVIPFAGPLQELEQEPTGRELEVLQLISDGLVNREIGQRLYLSEETVKSHVRHLLAKLQARSRAHAVAVGFRRGLIA
ncbi:MAG: response regulator transcription factor [Actinobacteria bacterium]|nr:MAG: response regulator transcription factor [Actinomycetota bacterium]